jgi:hypothetical protein
MPAYLAELAALQKEMQAPAVPLSEGGARPTAAPGAGATPDSSATTSVQNTPTPSPQITATLDLRPQAGEPLTVTLTLAPGAATAPSVLATQSPPSETLATTVTVTPPAGMPPALESTPRPTEEPANQDVERLSAWRRPTATPTSTAAVTATVPLSPTRPAAAAVAAAMTPIPSEPITALGDSVMLGAAPILRQAFTNIEVDAEVGRQAWTTAGLIRVRKAENRLGSVVVLHLGNNGRFTEQVFNEIMQSLTDRRMVIVYNVRVPREWEAYNNNIIGNGVKAYPNAVFVDWRGITADKPWVFWNDGHHLRPEGARFYAGLIAEAIKSKP